MITFITEPKLNFYQWLTKNFGSVDAFMKLKYKDKEKIFLRWKWSLSDEANYNLEMSRQSLLHMIENTESKDDSYADYFDKINKFNKECIKIKESIGLVKQQPDIYTKKVLNAFDGIVDD